MGLVSPIYIDNHSIRLYQWNNAMHGNWQYFDIRWRRVHVDTRETRHITKSQLQEQSGYLTDFDPWILRTRKICLIQEIGAGFEVHVGWHIHIARHSQWAFHLFRLSTMGHSPQNPKGFSDCTGSEKYHFILGVTSSNNKHRSPSFIHRDYL